MLELGSALEIQGIHNSLISLTSHATRKPNLCVEQYTKNSTGVITWEHVSSYMCPAKTQISLHICKSYDYALCWVYLNHFSTALPSIPFIFGSAFYGKVYFHLGELSDYMGHVRRKRAQLGFCSPLIHSIVSNDYVSRQQRPGSDCTDVQADLDFSCPHIPEDMLSHGAWCDMASGIKQGFLRHSTGVKFP